MDKVRSFWDKAAKNYDTFTKKYALTYRDTIELSKKYLDPNSPLLILPVE